MTVSWKDAEDAWLQLLYMNFINQNDLGTNIIMPGSARNVKALVSTLYKRLYAMNYGDGTIEKAIVNDILDRIKTGVTCTGEGTDLMVTNLGTYDSYPNDLDLPDGAAAVRWTDVVENEVTVKKFVPQTVTTLDAPINTINRFAYPPELYYYSNSKIKTSNTEILESDYGTYQSWSDALYNQYPYDNAVVSGDTKAVAIKEPLQYGVAHLVSIKALIPRHRHHHLRTAPRGFRIQGQDDGNGWSYGRSTVYIRQTFGGITLPEIWRPGWSFRNLGAAKRRWKGRNDHAGAGEQKWQELQRRGWHCL